jgi:hypothetical protein
MWGEPALAGSTTTAAELAELAETAKKSRVQGLDKHNQRGVVEVAPLAATTPLKGAVSAAKACRRQIQR